MLFFRSILEGSRDQVWDHVETNFWGLGRLLGGKMGEKREQKWRKQKESKKRAKKGQEWVGTAVSRKPLRLKSLSRRGPGEGGRQKSYQIQTRPSALKLAGGL